MTATVRPQGHRVPVQDHHRGVEVIPPPTEVPVVLVEPSPAVVPDGHDGAPSDALVHGRIDRRPIVRVSRSYDVLIATPVGLLQPDGFRKIERLLAKPDDVVVVDLDEAVVRDVSSLGTLLHTSRRDRDPIGDSPRRVCLVSRCERCRRTLARSGVADLLAVFSSVDDALQARVLQLAGYGRGWS